MTSPRLENLLFNLKFMEQCKNKVARKENAIFLYLGPPEAPPLWAITQRFRIKYNIGWLPSPHI